jgi:quinol-cytochrome oxidoreductase complex cytochrome b subunit
MSVTNKEGPKPILWRKHKSLLYHLYPAHLAAPSARFTYTLGLGGLAVLTTLLTTVTGLLLMFYYEPTLTGAHPSLTLIDSVVAYGRFVRALHYWAAQAMVLVVVLHMARVVFTGGYRPPRDLNWLIGLGLLVVTLLWNFTGYVLRMDADSIWALLVGTNLLKELPSIGAGLYRVVVGDAAISAGTVLRFYTWHVFGLTLVGVGGMAYHLWRIHVDGGLSRPDWAAGPPPSLIPPDGVLARDTILWITATAFLVLLAALAPPALGPAADLNHAGREVVLAPWIFLAVQYMLRYLPPLWAGWLLPLGGLALLAALAWLDRRGPGRGRWFARARRQPQVAFAGLLLLIIGLSLLEWLAA